MNNEIVKGGKTKYRRQGITALANAGQMSDHENQRTRLKKGWTREWRALVTLVWWA